MTIRELFEDGIGIQGKATIVSYNENTNKYTQLFTSEHFESERYDSSYDKTIKHMYSNSNGFSGIVFEVE